MTSPGKSRPDAPDLTTITTPWALLDDATREALIQHGGPYEYANAATYWRFVPSISPAWFPGTVYRVAPQPREWWITGGNCLWDTYTEAYNACDQGEKPIRVVEAGVR
jgi:hypothetical protein